MKKTLLILAAGLSFARFAQASAPVSIFDGQTLNGWGMAPANSWVVKNGIMSSTGNGRGEIYTKKTYGFYRVIFSHRHNIAATGNHYGSALIFCDTPPPFTDALHGIQFGLPNGPHWDYRAGHNNGGGSLFHVVKNPGFGYTTWSRVEILVDSRNGTARMAVAQPVGSPAVEVLDFKDATAGKVGPVAFQMHNAGLFDEYKDITIEETPDINDLITTKSVSANTVYQAEDGVLAGGSVVESINTGFNGTGYVNSSASGGSLTFNGVNGNGGGFKNLVIRYALGRATSRTGNIVVNGVKSLITFMPTASFSTWATMTVTISLNNSSTNVIAFDSTGNDLANIDEIIVP